MTDLSRHIEELEKLLQERGRIIWDYKRFMKQHWQTILKYNEIIADITAAQHGNTTLEGLPESP